MVTVVCSSTGCANNGITYNFTGFPDYVECGGCHTHLEPTDPRPDPEIPPIVPA